MRLEGRTDVLFNTTVIGVTEDRIEGLEDQEDQEEVNHKLDSSIVKQKAPSVPFLLDTSPTSFAKIRIMIVGVVHTG